MLKCWGSSLMVTMPTRWWRQRWMSTKVCCALEISVHTTCTLPAAIAGVQISYHPYHWNSTKLQLFGLRPHYVFSQQSLELGDSYYMYISIHLYTPLCLLEWSSAPPLCCWWWSHWGHASSSDRVPVSTWLQGRCKWCLLTKWWSCMAIQLLGCVYFWPVYWIRT